MRDGILGTLKVARTNEKPNAALGKEATLSRTGEEHNLNHAA